MILVSSVVQLLNMKARAKRTHPHIRSYKTRGVEFWRVTFSLNKHQVRKQGFHSFEAAEDYYASARKMIRAGQWSSKSLHEMTKWNLNELYEHYKKVMGHRRAYATQKNGQQFWRDHIGPHVGHYKVREISRRVLAHWVNQLREYPLTDNTIGSAKAEFRNVLKMCVEYELIEEAPQFPKLTKNPKKKEMLLL